MCFGLLPVKDKPDHAEHMRTHVGPAGTLPYSGGTAPGIRNYGPTANPTDATFWKVSLVKYLNSYDPVANPLSTTNVSVPVVDAGTHCHFT